MQDEAVFRGDAITDMVTDHHLMPASIRWKHLNHFGWVCWHQARVKLCCVTAQISGHPFAQIHRARRVTMPPDEQLRQGGGFELVSGGWGPLSESRNAGYRVSDSLYML